MSSHRLPGASLAEADPWSPSLGALLHFTPVLASISSRCFTVVARERIQALWPTDDLPTIQERITATAELLTLVERRSLPPLGHFPDIQSALDRLRLGVEALSREDIHQIRQVLELLEPLVKFIKEQVTMPYWQGLLDDLKPWPEGLAEINRVVSAGHPASADEPTGQQQNLTIKSTASKALQQIRKLISQCEQRARRELEALHQKALKAGWGQNEPIAWRDGRLVIALKASHKRKIQGLTHGISSSGATAFVEPLTVFDLNNEIAALREDEQAEEHRLLVALTGILRPQGGELAGSLEILFLLDVHLAQARWADDQHAVQPQITPNGYFKVIGARNPVLAEHRDVVPMDLALGESERILLISGPNAGGKTVVLLTVGLMVMLAQCGLFIPAKQASLPLYTGLFADLGDHQSLVDDLSTFSAHLLNLKSIYATCDRGSLILLDELGAGTEPEAGAALGQTFLEAIHTRGAMCLATTHLTRLKLWAQDEPGILNAGMAFDPDELRPTYRLQIGRPGASFALEIARRMGLDEALLQRAQDLMPDVAVNLEDLLVTLQNDRARLDREKSELLGRIKEVAAQEQSISTQEAEIKATHRHAHKEALQAAEQLVSDMNRRLEAAIAEVREQGAQLGKDDIRRAKEIVGSERQWVLEEQTRLANQEPDKLTIEDVVPGTWVMIRAQGRRGQVEQVSRGKQRVTLLIEGTRLTLPLDQLAADEGAPQVEPSSEPEVNVRVGASLAGDASYRLDLRGQRGEAAVAAVDRFLDRGVLAGLIQLEIIHGKGAGILQTLVRELLADHPQVQAYDYANFDAGGTGVTLVTLK